MNTTTRPPTPVYERRPDCPSWCTAHRWDGVPGRELALMGHAATLGEGEDELELYLAADGTNLHAADQANVERTPEELRTYAALLLEAADTLDEGTSGK